MKPYTANEVQAIVDEAFRRGVETQRHLHPDSPIPAAPRLHEIVDHPFHGSDAPGQPKQPWLNDERGQRGLVRRLSDQTPGGAVPTSTPKAPARPPLEDAVSKLLGLPPFDGPGNRHANDPSYHISLVGEFGREAVEAEVTRQQAAAEVRR